jgi:sulfhydrogenase subunit beta (sulfur reductase)
MEAVFISELKPFLDTVAEQMELYVPKKSGRYYVYSKYDPSAEIPAEFNNIRPCMPVKEFLFPLLELAATYPDSSTPKDIKPFAVFGLKNCDLRSLEILDKVFLEDEFEDPGYVARREKMFIISSDCFAPAESCFCNVLDVQPYAESGFDLNVSQVKGGFIIEPGSQKGRDFIEKHARLFTEVGDDALDERDKVRAETKKQLEQQNADLKLDAEVRDIMTETQDSDVFDEEAKTCVECQACTRVCPTCHCFYLYDTKQKDYFSKMKMWDSCMRLAYAQVAGGANPRNVLGDRLKHRLMHKLAYFFDRYGIDMCVGCGRCVDAEVGGVDIRRVLRKLNQALKVKSVQK